MGNIVKIILPVVVVSVLGLGGWWFMKGEKKDTSMQEKNTSDSTIVEKKEVTEKTVAVNPLPPATGNVDDITKLLSQESFEESTMGTDMDQDGSLVTGDSQAAKDFSGVYDSKDF